MLHTVYFDFSDGAAGHRGQQNTTQRIAQGMTEATLERLQCHGGAGIRGLINFDDAGSQKLSDRTLHKAPSIASGIGE